MIAKNIFYKDESVSEKLRVDIIRRMDLFNLECKNCKHVFKEINVKNTISSKIYVHCSECNSFFYIDFNYDLRTLVEGESYRLEGIPVGLIDVSKKEVLEDVMFNEIRHELIEA